MRILAFGALPHRDYSKTLGGVTILNKNLKDFWNIHGVNFKWIQFSNYDIPKGLRWLFPYISLIRYIQFYDVCYLNVTRNSLYYFTPFAYCMARLFGKSIVVRVFGGNLDVSFSERNYLVKIIAKCTAFRADIFYVETQYLLNGYLNLHIPKLEWFPNSRNMNHSKQVDTQYKHRFVYMGRVSESKGILHLVKAFDHLQSPFILDLYGPLENPEVLFGIGSSSNVRYMGVLKEEFVLDTLCRYNVMMLATYHEGEGYPGSMLEAQSIGMPIICTRWRSLNEIVIHGRNGITVPIKNVEALTQAILSVNQCSYTSMVKASLNIREQFDQDFVLHRNLTQIKNL